MRDVRGTMGELRGSIQCDAPVCGNSGAVFQCTDCKAVYYCSAMCKEQHAIAHGPRCEALMRKWKDSLDESPRPEKGSGIFLSVPSPASKDEVICGFIADLCCICLEDPSENSAPVAILEACKHVFCLPCLVGWQRHSISYEDPAERDDNSTHLEDIALQDGYATLEMPQLSDSRKKSLHCPCCRSETDDAEETLLYTAKYNCDRAMRRGCPSVLKAHLLHEALGAASALLQVQEPNLHAYYSLANVLSALDRPQDAIATVHQLLKIDKERHSAIQSQPVLAWIEYARESYEAGDYAQAAVALTTASKLATRFGSPARPPPSLHGRERTLMYQSVYLLLGEAYIKLNQWTDALRVYNKLLPAHIEFLAAQKTEAGDDDSNAVSTQIWKGMAVCSYELGAYVASIDAVDRAVAIDRSAGGLHRYKASSLMKLAEQLPDETHTLRGQAVLTMNQAVLYETPWDPEVRTSNLELLQSLCQGITLDSVARTEFLNRSKLRS